MSSEPTPRCEKKAPLRVEWKVRVKWEPRDVWLGLYWTHPESFAGRPPRRRSRQWFVCLVPCLPIIVTRCEVLR